MCFYIRFPPPFPCQHPIVSLAGSHSVTSQKRHALAVHSHKYHSHALLTWDMASVQLDVLRKGMTHGWDVLWNMCDMARKIMISLWSPAKIAHTPEGKERRSERAQPETCHRAQAMDTQMTKLSEKSPSAISTS